MSDHGGLMRRLIASICALLPEDWLGQAGHRFHKTVDAISQFADEHQCRASDLAGEGVELARTALHGKANKDLAAAVKDFAEAEDKNIDTELKRRSLQSDIRKKVAEARKAEIEVLSSELELVKRLKELGVLLRWDNEGNLTVLPVPADIDLEKLKDRFLPEKTHGRSE